MGFLLKKFVSYWLMPIPLSLLLMTTGLMLLALGRRKRTGKTLLICGFLCLLLTSNGFVAHVLIHPLENRFRPIPELVEGAELPQSLADCSYIVVLGSGHYSEEKRPALAQLSESALARLSEGVRLAKAHPKAKVIFSGPADKLGITHASVMARAAVSLGIQPERIQQIDTALDTFDEARGVAKIVGAEKLALITSAYHMPRANALFVHQGLQTLPCPTEFKERPLLLRDTSTWDWDANALMQSTVSIREYLGLLWSKLRGQT